MSSLEEEESELVLALMCRGELYSTVESWVKCGEAVST